MHIFFFPKKSKNPKSTAEAIANAVLERERGMRQRGDLTVTTRIFAHPLPNISLSAKTSLSCPFETPLKNLKIKNLKIFFLQEKNKIK